MPLTLPPLPTRAELVAARKIAGNPSQFLHERDFIFLINNAWWALKADQMDRMAVKRTAELIVLLTQRTRHDPF